jgi:carbonic anhydrase
MQLFVVTSILLIILFHRISSETWNYGDLGPDVWSDTYPSCSGQSQSPINILTACTNYRSWVPFQFSSDYSTLQNFTLTNNGHTIVANYFGNGSAPFTLRGAGLGTTFQFVNFHLHWGENYKSGSEHQV